MSGILGVFTAGGTPPPNDSIVQDMLGRASLRGNERAAIWRDGAAALAAARNEWELGAGFSGPVLVAHDGDLAVAADASIYYRDDLRRALEARGVHPAGDTPSHLILAAYRAWGERCAEHLEGDFAFVLWDARTRSVCAARDFYGTRPLYYAETAGTLAIGSAASGVAALPDHPQELNLAIVGATAAGFFGHGYDTCYRGVRVVPAGATLVRRGATTRLTRHWDSPRFEARSDIGFEEAAAELRELLCRAVAERMADDGPTGIWLSGGWDSTAVFAAGERVLRDREEGRHLDAVSVSYPPNDPGHEDDLIGAVTSYWGSPVHWLHAYSIPVFHRPLERAAVRDIPFAHPFEQWHRTLARGARSQGARLAFNGTGGDHLFQVSNIYLADLFRSGRWLSLSREWQAKGLSGSGFRTFFRWAVQPTLPPPLLHAAALLRGGRPLRGYLERGLPDWIDRDFASRHDLVPREQHNNPPRNRDGHAAYEMRWFLTHEVNATYAAATSGYCLEEGVEARSPLLDRRIVEFAASRPRAERTAGRETKRLLRRSMNGLLPDHVLAPRTRRTGVTGGYYSRALRQVHADFLREVVHAPLVLADLGIVYADEFRKQCDDYLRSRNNDLGIHLFLTMQAELWLRAHSASGPNQEFVMNSTTETAELV